jgi:hypothetical protein
MEREEREEREEIEEREVRESREKDKKVDKNQNKKSVCLLTCSGQSAGCCKMFPVSSLLRDFDSSINSHIESPFSGISEDDTGRMSQEREEREGEGEEKRDNKRGKKDKIWE